MPVANSSQTIFAPSVGSGPRVVVGKVLPRSAIGAVILAHGSPLPFTQVRSPAFPVNVALAGFFQSNFLLSHFWPQRTGKFVAPNFHNGPGSARLLKVPEFFPKREAWPGSLGPFSGFFPAPIRKAQAYRIFLSLKSHVPEIIIRNVLRRLPGVRVDALRVRL